MHLTHCYLAARDGLHGILRTERTLQGDSAEWLVATVPELQLTSSPVQKGRAALDPAGRRYQIQSRIVQNPAASTSFDFASNELTFDVLVAVLFSPHNLRCLTFSVFHGRSCWRSPPTHPQASAFGGTAVQPSILESNIGS